MVPSRSSAHQSRSSNPIYGFIKKQSSTYNPVQIPGAGSPSYTSGATVTTFAYDGVDLVAEYSGPTTTTPLRRFLHGTATDDPLVWLEGSGTSDIRYIFTNYQGSVIATIKSDGTTYEMHKYGPYGEPKDSNNDAYWSAFRFGYTGQTLLKEARLYYYKARVYDPIYGHFMQTDPIGSKDDLNLYAYVGNDPINRADPTGLFEVVAEPIDRKPAQDMINANSKSQYEFNQSGVLEKGSGVNSEGSAEYSATIDSMISSPHTATVAVGPLFNLPDGKAYKPDDFGGGMTVEATSRGVQDVVVLLSGNGASTALDIDGNVLNQTAGDIAMHEFEVHAEPIMSTGIDGSIANENKSRSEMGWPLRGPEGGHK